MYTLEKAEKKDWRGLVGFEANLPPLPKRPATKRARRVPLGPRPAVSGAKKRKRSVSRPPVSGGHRPALGPVCSNLFKECFKSKMTHITI